MSPNPSDATASRAELLARAAYRRDACYEAMQERDHDAAARHSREADRLAEMAGRAWQ